jgi:Cu(I)/Ag(I) efflux system membrane fusion protein
MMRKLSYSLLLFAVAGAAYMAGSWHAPRETVSAAGAETARTPLYYQCPMHVDFKSKDRATPCGLCGMALEPVHAGGAPDRAASGERLPDGVIVSTAQQQLIGVRVGTVEKAPGTEQVRVFGRVTPDETRVRRLTAGLEAYVTELSAVTTGSRVGRDQWLASYSTPEARGPISAFITTVNVLEREENNGDPAPASLAAARTSMALAVDRLLTMGMSRVQIEDIRRSRAATTTVKLTSPVDGFVLARNVSDGQRFDAGTELFQIADLQRVWILADVPVADADHVRPGTVAQVRVGGRETAVRARVSRTVLPQFDRTTQSFKLRLEADNPGFVLRPDMFVDVEFQVPYESTMMVPVDAVVLSGLHTRVFVERSAGVFEPREVETGRRHGGRIAVVKGLKAGERVALSGTFLLDSERRMKTNDRPHQ